MKAREQRKKSMKSVRLKAGLHRGEKKHIKRALGPPSCGTREDRLTDRRIRCCNVHDAKAWRSVGTETERIGTPTKERSQVYEFSKIHINNL